MFKKLLAKVQVLQRRWLRWWGNEDEIPCSYIAAKMLELATADPGSPVVVQLVRDAILSILKKNYASAVVALQLALDELANEQS